MAALLVKRSITIVVVPKKMLSLLESSMTVAQLYHDYSMTVA